MRSRRIRLILLSVLLVAGAVAIWSQARHVLVPKRFAVVEQGRIFRSGQIDDRLIEKVLRENKIRLVIMMLRNDGTEDAKVQEETMRRLDIEFLHFPLRGDGTGDPRCYADALVALTRAQQNEKPVLIHCSAGTERTGGVVALYRILIQGRQPREAYDELCNAGHDPERNPKLVQFLDAQMDVIANRLVDRGAIAQVPSPMPLLRR